MLLGRRSAQSTHQFSEDEHERTGAIDVRSASMLWLKRDLQLRGRAGEYFWKDAAAASFQEGRRPWAATEKLSEGARFLDYLLGVNT